MKYFLSSSTAHPQCYKLQPSFFPDSLETEEKARKGLSQMYPSRMLFMEVAAKYPYLDKSFFYDSLNKINIYLCYLCSHNSRYIDRYR